MSRRKAALAAAMGVQRQRVNELCSSRTAMTAPTTLMLARVFGNSADFGPNAQRRSDLWEALCSSHEREPFERVRPLTTAARPAPGSPISQIGLSQKRRATRLSSDFGAPYFATGLRSASRMYCLPATAAISVFLSA